jgi:hypothetical protein
VLFSPVNLLLSQNYNISLRGLWKSARRRACALERAWRCFRNKDIDHSFNGEHECTPLILPRTMAVHGYLSSEFRRLDQAQIVQATEVESVVKVHDPCNGMGIVHTGTYVLHCKLDQHWIEDYIVNNLWLIRVHFPIPLSTSAIQDYTSRSDSWWSSMALWSLELICIPLKI